MEPAILSHLNFVSPRTPAEELVASIYGALLGVDEVSIHDSFFALGGNSLLAIFLRSRLRDIFRMEVSVRALSESPTVAMLVDEMSRMWGGREIVEEIAWTFMQVEELSESEAESILSNYILQAEK